MRTHPPSNTDDVVDSRDILARIDELESERADLETEDERAAWDEENGEELKTLKALDEDAKGYSPDWKYGATLVRESYWVEYVQELLEDCGDLPKELPHYIEIDWEKTAKNIRADYTSVEWDGVTYYVR